MPKASEKTKLFEFLLKKTIQDVMILEDTDCADQIDDVMDEFCTALIAMNAYRYAVPFNIGSVAKSLDILWQVIPNLDEQRFRQIVRMNWNTFDYICHLIENDPVFNGQNSWKQFPVEMQLAIVLYRLGSSGEAASICKVSKLFGVGDGGTLAKITKRVFKALCNNAKFFLNWPDSNRRKEIINYTSSELPYCLGYVDGSEIRLAEKPTIDPEAYYSRKQQYSLKLQAVCDYDLKIMHVVIGYPGSVHDSRIFKNSSLFTRQVHYFSDNEWIAGDSAYKLSKTVITPYRSNSSQGTLNERNDFNRSISKYRVRIENCFGLLKERFSSLKELKLILGTDANNRFACQWIFVCCVLHNIIKTLGSDEFPQEDLTYDTCFTSEDDVGDHEDTNEDAELKRRAILEILRDRN